MCSMQFAEQSTEGVVNAAVVKMGSGWMAHHPLGG